MAFEQVLGTITLPAAGDLSGAQFKFLVQDGTTGLMRLPTSEAEYTLGVCQNIPSATVGNDSIYQYQPVIAYAGVCRIRVDDAYAVGTFLMPEFDGGSAANTGRGTTAASTPKFARAITLQASTLTDDVIACLLLGPNPGSGDSGVSGFSGYSGDNSGTSGYSGPTGDSGYSGYSGGGIS